MRDKSSALEASERSIKESISRVRECDIGVSAGRGQGYLRRGKPRREPSAFEHRNFFWDTSKVSIF